MPNYDFDCPAHGKFEIFQHMKSERKALCPECGANSLFVFPHVGIRIINRIRYELGSKAPSQLVESNVPGGLPSYVMSEGALEQEEIDHIGLVQDEREIARQKQEKSDTKKAISNIVTTAKKQKQGKRFSTMKELQKVGM